MFLHKPSTLKYDKIRDERFLRERRVKAINRLAKSLKEVETAIENLMIALEKGGTIVDMIANRIQEKNKIAGELIEQITLEQAKQINLTIPEVKFFLNQLKKRRYK